MLSSCSHWKANINIATAVLNAVTNLRYSILEYLKSTVQDFMQPSMLPSIEKKHLLQFYFSNVQGSANCT